MFLQINIKNSATSTANPWATENISQSREILYLTKIYTVKMSSLKKKKTTTGKYTASLSNSGDVVKTIKSNDLSVITCIQIGPSIYLKTVSI